MAIKMTQRLFIGMLAAAIAATCLAAEPEDAQSIRMPSRDPKQVDDHPVWIDAIGSEVVGVPLKSTMAADGDRREWIFRSPRGKEFSVPWGDFSDETNRAISRHIDDTRLQKKADAKMQALREQEAAGRRRQEEEQRRLEEQRKQEADFAARQYRLADGGVVSGAKLIEHNKQVELDCAKCLLEANADTRFAMPATIRNFLPIMEAVKQGDQARLAGLMRQVANLGDMAQDMRWLVEDTPMGGVVIPCNDGRALHWHEAWAEGTKVLVESLKAEGR